MGRERLREKESPLGRFPAGTQTPEARSRGPGCLSRVPPSGSRRLSDPLLVRVRLRADPGLFFPRSRSRPHPTDADLALANRSEQGAPLVCPFLRSLLPLFPPLAAGGACAFARARSLSKHTCKRLLFRLADAAIPSPLPLTATNTPTATHAGSTSRRTAACARLQPLADARRPSLRVRRPPPPPPPRLSPGPLLPMLERELVPPVTRCVLFSLSPCLSSAFSPHGMPRRSGRVRGATRGPHRGVRLLGRSSPFRWRRRAEGKGEGLACLSTGADAPLAGPSPCSVVRQCRIRREGSNSLTWVCSLDAADLEGGDVASAPLGRSVSLGVRQRAGVLFSPCPFLALGRDRPSAFMAIHDEGRDPLFLSSSFATGPASFLPSIALLPSRNRG